MRPGTATAILLVLACAGRASLAAPDEPPTRRPDFAEKLRVAAIAVSGDGSRIALTTWDEKHVVRVTIHDAEGRELSRFETSPYAHVVGFAGPDASTVVTTGGNPTVWDVATGRSRRVLELSAPRPKDDPAFARSHAVAVSARDRIVAVAHPDRRVRLFNLATEREVGSFEFDGPPIEAALSTDGARLAITMHKIGGGRLVEVFDVPRRALAWKQELFKYPGEPGEPLIDWTTAAFSPDRAALVVTCDEERANDRRYGALRSYDAAKGAVRWTRRFEERGVLRATFSPKGDRIAAATTRGVVLLDAKTGADLGSLGGPGDVQNELAFSKDGRFLFGACAHSPGVVRWDLEAEGPAMAASPPASDDVVPLVPLAFKAKSSIEAFAVSPDGRTFVTSERADGTTFGDASVIRAYDAAKGTMRREFGAEEKTTRVLQFFGGDPDWLLSQVAHAERASYWSVSSGTRKRLLDDRPAREAGRAPVPYVLCVAGAPSSREIAVGYRPDRSEGKDARAKLHVLDAVTGAVLADLPLLDWADVPDVPAAWPGRDKPMPVAPEAACWSADGNSLAVVLEGMGTRILTYERADGKAPWQRAALVQDAGSFEDQRWRFWDQVAFTPDARFVVAQGSYLHSATKTTIDLTYVVRTWEPAASAARWTPTFEPKDLVCDVAVSPRGDGVAVATSESLEIVNPATGEVRRKLARTGLLARRLAFSPDGRTLYAVSTKLGDDGPRTLVSWDLGPPK